MNGGPPESVIEGYARQYSWRRWSEVYGHLGDLRGAEVADLGCGIGDQARDLSELGARVLGVDGNAGFIAHAAARGIPQARFVCGGIGDVGGVQGLFDGVWASFVVAYFPRCEDLLGVVEGVLAPGGWLALTEVDELFGHRPLLRRWVSLAERYAEQSASEGVYRFRSRELVVEALRRRGWGIEVDRVLDDDEFSFAGPAGPEVLAAWKGRVGRMMPRFRERFGAEADGFDAALLECLSKPGHVSLSRVWFILARAPGGEGGSGGAGVAGFRRPAG